MHFELWDLQTANLLGEYDTEAEALADVRDALAAGWASERLGLGREFDDGDIGDDDELGPTWSGAELAARASAQGSPTPSIHQRSA
jgi:hypothetical protein